MLLVEVVWKEARKYHGEDSYTLTIRENHSRNLVMIVKIEMKTFG
jgi:hypothetical protein